MRPSQSLPLALLVDRLRSERFSHGRWDNKFRFGGTVEEAVERAVNRSIEFMHQHIGDPLTIDDMAKAAMFSKFHFSRVFQRVTGVSPGRFLSAIRLQEAKRLFADTTMSVTEVSHRVGYASVGTFSSRFAKSVGVSPTTYRRLGGCVGRIRPDDRLRPTPTRPAVVSGRVLPPAAGRPGTVFLGLFQDWFPDGQPVRCSVLGSSGPYSLTDVPLGTWHLLACSTAITDKGQRVPAQRDGRNDAMFVGSYGPVTIRPDTLVRPVDVRLRPVNAFDPPVLLALLDNLQPAS
jgi:AraC family transcriptional regulator